MSRRKSAVKRPVPPDPRYDSQTVSKFVCNLMLDGKKSLAEQIFYGAMDLIEERTGQPGVAVFKQAVANAKPAVEVKSRRVGGASLQVPVEVQLQYAPVETDFFARATSGVESSLSPLVPLNARLAVGVGGGTVHADPSGSDPSRRVLLGPTFGGNTP